MDEVEFFFFFFYKPCFLYFLLDYFSCTLSMSVTLVIAPCNLLEGSFVVSFRKLNLQLN